MNRKERRSVEKKLKLTKFYSKQTLSQRLERISSNISNGKKHQIEFNNEINVKLQEQRDVRNSNIIEGYAVNIAKAKGIPYIDALSEANKLKIN